jgi:hypothetical protein
LNASGAGPLLRGVLQYEPPVNQSPLKPDRHWVSIPAWIFVALATTGVLFFLLYPVLFGVRDSVSRIDAETQVLQVALSQYKAELGRFPSGDSRAICRALSGVNPKGIRFIEWRQKSTTAEGEFLDPWGTPYRIYFSGDIPLIRSAGKNKYFDSSNQKGADDYFGG